MPVDLSDVYDFSEAVDPSGFRGGRGVGDAVRTELRPASPLPLSVPAAAFSLLRHPGLVVVPGALSQEQQVCSLSGSRLSRGLALGSHQCRNGLKCWACSRPRPLVICSGGSRARRLRAWSIRPHSRT